MKARSSDQLLNMCIKHNMQQSGQMWLHSTVLCDVLDWDGHLTETLPGPRVP